MCLGVPGSTGPLRCPSLFPVRMPALRCCPKDLGIRAVCGCWLAPAAFRLSRRPHFAANVEVRVCVVRRQRCDSAATLAERRALAVVMVAARLGAPRRPSMDGPAARHGLFHVWSVTRSCVCCTRDVQALSSRAGSVQNEHYEVDLSAHIRSMSEAKAAHIEYPRNDHKAEPFQRRLSRPILGLIPDSTVTLVTTWPTASRHAQEVIVVRGAKMAAIRECIYFCVTMGFKNPALSLSLSLSLSTTFSRLLLSVRRQGQRQGTCGQTLMQVPRS